MNRIFSLTVIASMVLASGLGCGEPEAAPDLEIERLEDVAPSLPSVPTIPPDPYPIQHSDGAFTVLGIRRRGHHIMDGENTDRNVRVTAYIVRIFEPAECPEGETCPRPAAPHLYLADSADNTDEREWLMVTGYAQNHEEYNQAVEDASRGRYEPPDPESGILPIPTDFAVGNKVRFNGRLARLSSMGFRHSEGLIDYRGHETLETATAE